MTRQSVSMAAQLTDTDRAHLRRALDIAAGGRGKVSPNPLVGAVIVRDGKTIGEGFHAKLGEAHAERAALDDCHARGEDPHGATMYVTLEPCAHQGRQPPCADLILNSGVKRVVIASEDPTAKASGRGPGMLRDGGIQVDFASGEEATAARLLNQPFRKHGRTGLPLVTLKLAISLDGRTATAPEDSPWISGEQSRKLVHRWRSEADAVAVGIGTVLADDPLLTARTPATARQPARVVFDSQARLPLNSQLVETISHSPVLVVASQEVDPARLAALRDAGVETLIASGATPGERIHAALADLGRRDIADLFLEGGRTLASAFIAADAVDQARTFVAPILLGSGAGRAGPVAAGDPPPPAVAKASSGVVPPTAPPARETALHKKVETVGEDVLITARFKEW